MEALPWTVDTDAASDSDMRASMRFRHHGNYCNSRGSPHGLGQQKWNNNSFILFWHCSYELSKLRQPLHAIFLGALLFYFDYIDLSALFLG